MRIHYREIENGIEVVRCFGSDGEITIPEMIGGKPVIRAAAYAFSARKGREDEDILVCETGELRLFRQQETLLAGENVLRVRFPDTLREIGKYIFYGCRNLEHLSFSDSLTEIGSGAFTGCRSLSSLNVHLCRGKRSCVPEILGDLWQRIDVEFWADSAGIRNRQAAIQARGSPRHTPLNWSAGTSQRLAAIRATISNTPDIIARRVKPSP